MTRRALWSSRLLSAQHASFSSAPPAIAPAALFHPSHQICPSRRSTYRSFAHVYDYRTGSQHGSASWFSSSAPRASEGGSLGPNSPGDHQPPDERTLQLGRTVRILHERLPTLLKEPLPSDVLSPQITLHLFPSTHPHLPTVSGRLAYVAALWTAPVAWGRVPLVGNVRLTILSERMVRHGGAKEEKLIVKWKTCGRTTHRDGTGGVYRGGAATSTSSAAEREGTRIRDPVDRIREFIAGARTSRANTPSSSTSPTTTQSPQQTQAPYSTEEEPFCGIFIFEFDERGRIAKHIIEHTDEAGHRDQRTRVVSVTDWLLGTFHGKRSEPALAWCCTADDKMAMHDGGCEGHARARNGEGVLHR